MNQMVPVQSSPPAPKSNARFELTKVANEIRETEAVAEAVMRHSRHLHSAQFWEADEMKRGRQAVAEAKNWTASGAFAEAKEAIEHAGTVADRHFLARELKLLAGAWPNTSKADLAVFAALLAHDISEAAPSRYAIAKCCQTLRRTKNFLPTIAEVLTEITSDEQFIRNIRRLLSEIPHEVASVEQQLQYHEGLITSGLRSAPARGNSEF